MTASTGLIWRMASIPAVIAGLKCAPETTASVCTSMNSTNTCTSPITEKSMNGCCPFTGGGSAGPRRVTVALDFTPNGVHAGIYTAVQKGFDRKHGVRLVIRQPSASTDSLKMLAAGRADLAIVDIHDLGLASEKGADIVGVGELVHRPLASVIAQRSVPRPR